MTKQILMDYTDACDLIEETERDIDIEQFLNMTEKDMRILLEQYPKGKRK